MAVDPENPEQQQQALRRFAQDDTHFALGRIAVFQYTALGIFLLLIAGFWILQVRDARKQQRTGGAQPHQDRAAAGAAREDAGSRRARDCRQSSRLHAVSDARESEAGASGRASPRGWHLDPERSARAREAFSIAPQIRADADEAGSDAAPRSRSSNRIATRTRSRKWNWCRTSVGCIRKAAWRRT